ncbi:hypothetical protein SDC9_173679 [bioreactor metagenome]|uniref:Uncharacterized protein n=1 Tax=bioreactor metagenome TaxID=1076179 RepID=A0A645GHU0_9ZZZZ
MDVVLTKVQDSLTLVVRGKAVSLKMLASGDDPVVRKVKFITTVIKAGKRLFVLVRPKRVPPPGVRLFAIFIAAARLRAGRHFLHGGDVQEHQRHSCRHTDQCVRSVTQKPVLP